MMEINDTGDEYTPAVLLRGFLWNELMNASHRIVNGISKRDHMFQCAQLAQRDGKKSDYIAAALFHDIMGAYCPEGHGKVVAEMLKPYVKHETYYVLGEHEIFQKDNWAGEPHGSVSGPRDLATIEFCDKYDFPAFDKDWELSYDFVEEMADLVRWVIK